jgi:glucose/arabinose dehydrogenase
MKRILLISATAAAFAFFACGSDDDGGGGGTKTDAGTGGNSGGSGGNTGGSGGSTGGNGGSGGSTGGSGGVGGATGGASGGGGTAGGTGGVAGGGTGGTPGQSLNCTAASGNAPALKLTQYQPGYSSPIVIEAATGDPRLFIGEQAGVIRIIDGNGQKVATPFLDITGRVKSGGEQGLLGLAFHPNFATNGKFYVHYSDDGSKNDPGDTVISEFTLTSANVANPNSEKVLLTVSQPYDNHNGGAIHFRNDGKLYIGLGDGGDAGDPNGYAQNLGTKLGKMLRIDVDTTTGNLAYGIPVGNMVGDTTQEEIWAYGLRNPWRWSFDGCTWDMYIGDVGQNQIEEVDVEPAAKGSGTNWGWKEMEGNQCFVSNCDQTGKELPIAQYTHSLGQVITGGYVYRGSAIPGLRGSYIYADYASGNFWTLKWTGGATATPTNITSDINPNPKKTGIATFGQDASGELYIAAGSTIYKIESQ